MSIPIYGLNQLNVSSSECFCYDSDFSVYNVAQLFIGLFPNVASCVVHFKQLFVHTYILKGDLKQFFTQKMPSSLRNMDFSRAIYVLQSQKYTWLIEPFVRA